MDNMDRQRALWAAGDYPDLARTIEEVAEVAVEAAGVGEGDAVLDVATGSGNAALAAAARGARVTGLDLVPQLLARARERAADQGLSITFDEGDAQQLPYDDAAFDRVTSVFGAMFAPDQTRTAGELRRVCREDGTIVVTAWTPEGLNGRVFAVTAKHMPPPPPDFQPPVLWGVEEHVRGLFAGAEVQTERRTVPVEGDSTELWVQYLSRVLGPLATARAALEAEGGWEPLRDDMVAMYEGFNEATDGTLRAKAEYLVATVRP
jgi:SAM-dependent methyltransferase